MSAPRSTRRLVGLSTRCGFASVNHIRVKCGMCLSLGGRYFIRQLPELIAWSMRFFGFAHTPLMTRRQSHGPIFDESTSAHRLLERSRLRGGRFAWITSEAIG